MGFIPAPWAVYNTSLGRNWQLQTFVCCQAFLGLYTINLVIYQSHFPAPVSGAKYVNMVNNWYFTVFIPAVVVGAGEMCSRLLSVVVRRSFVACRRSREGLVGGRRGWERWWRYVDARGEEGVGWVGWQGWQGTWQGSTGSIGLTHCELLTSVRD